MMHAAAILFVLFAQSEGMTETQALDEPTPSNIAPSDVTEPLPLLVDPAAEAQWVAAPAIVVQPEPPRLTSPRPMKMDPVPNLVPATRFALAGVGIVGAGSFLVGAGTLLVANYVWALSIMRANAQRQPLLLSSSVVLGGVGIGFVAVAFACAAALIGLMAVSRVLQDAFPSGEAAPQ